MTTAIASGSFLDVMKYYAANAGLKTKTQYVREDGADASTLKETLRSLGLDQPKLSDAVQAFQRQYNAEHPDAPLKLDGKAGGATLEALYGSADALRSYSGADTARFMEAKSKAATMLGPKHGGATKLNSRDPAAIRDQLNKKLDGENARLVDDNGEKVPGYKRQLAEDNGEKIPGFKRQLAEDNGEKIGGLTPQRQEEIRQYLQAKSAGLGTPHISAPTAGELDQYYEQKDQTASPLTDARKEEIRRFLLEGVRRGVSTPTDSELHQYHREQAKLSPPLTLDRAEEIRQYLAATQNGLGAPRHIRAPSQSELVKYRANDVAPLEA